MLSSLLTRKLQDAFFFSSKKIKTLKFSKYCVIGDFVNEL